jgi:hypothetical protein
MEAATLNNTYGRSFTQRTPRIRGACSTTVVHSPAGARGAHRRSGFGTVRELDAGHRSREGTVVLVGCRVAGDAVARSEVRTPDEERIPR